ncbi:MAG: glycosyltransferase [Planctomycetota bacterium]
MNILIVSPFAADAARGNSMAAARFVEGFRIHGHKVVHIDSIAQLSPTPEQLGDAIRAAGPPDVALILHAGYGASAAVALQASRIPYVVSLRGTDVNGTVEHPGRTAAIRATLAGAARITVFHDAMRDQLTHDVPEIAGRVRLVPNGLSLPQSSEDYRTRLGLSSDAFVFLSLAGLRAIKRPIFPIENLAPLVQEFPKVRFARAGPALEADVVAAMRAAVAAHAWVVDASEIPHRTVDSFLRSGDVFVSSSLAEGMPHAVREAMLAGRALLLSDIPGHRAIAEPDHEALFFGDGNSFRNAARRLIKDADLRQRLGNAARARVVRELTTRDEIGEYLDLLDECRCLDR